jgi:hypothetical protein
MTNMFIKNKCFWRQYCVEDRRIETHGNRSHGSRVCHYQYRIYWKNFIFEMLNWGIFIKYHYDNKSKSCLWSRDINHQKRSNRSVIQAFYCISKLFERMEVNYCQWKSNVLQKKLISIIVNEICFSTYEILKKALSYNIILQTWRKKLFKHFNCSNFSWERDQFLTEIDYNP